MLHDLALDGVAKVIAHFFAVFLGFACIQFWTADSSDVANALLKAHPAAPFAAVVVDAYGGRSYLLRSDEFKADIADNPASTEGGLVSAADKKLADAYAGIFRAFLKHRNSVKMVTFWGVNDAVSWRRQGRPLLFDGDNKPKLAFHSVIAETKKPAATK